MKKLQLFMLMLALAFLSSGVMAQSASKSKSLKPANFKKKIATIVSGKTKDYYLLSAANPSVISLNGPGKLRVVTRGRFAPGKADKLAYEIVYVIDGGSQKSIKMSAVGRSKSATYLDGTLGAPGELKDFEISLGRGNHTIEFNLKDEKNPVAAQYIFTPLKEKKREWIEFNPSQPSEPVDIVSKESTTTYYRFSAEKPVKVKVIGVTELRILTRIENHFQMKGRVNYRVQIKENGKVINTYQLSSRPSETAVYKNDKALIPGKACEFVINVPSGEHSYEILVLDKNNTSVISRFLLPKKDLKPKK